MCEKTTAWKQLEWPLSVAQQSPESNNDGIHQKATKWKVRWNRIIMFHCTAEFNRCNYRTAEASLSQSFCLRQKNSSHFAIRGSQGFVLACVFPVSNGRKADAFLKWPDWHSKLTQQAQEQRWGRMQTATIAQSNALSKGPQVTKSIG